MLNLYARQEFYTELMDFLKSIEKCPIEIIDFVKYNTKKDGKNLEINDFPIGLTTKNTECFRIHTEVVGTIREGFIDSVRIESVATDKRQEFVALYFANNNKCLVWSNIFGMFIVFDNGAMSITDFRNQAYNDIRSRADIAMKRVNNDMARMLTFVRNQSEKEYLQIAEKSRQIKEDGFRSN
jgi:hypothetical protein